MPTPHITEMRATIASTASTIKVVVIEQLLNRNPVKAQAKQNVVVLRWKRC
jgi:hypothetical protein